MAPVRMNWLPTKNATAKRMMTMIMVVRDVVDGSGFLELLSDMVLFLRYW